MASATTTSFPVPATALALRAAAMMRSDRRRRITPQAGHALEILGHAIEYLTDEYIHQGLDFSANSGELQAVQLLMALNRQVYYECPEVPTFGERFRALLPFYSA
jgi:hypothetical protein